MVFKIKRAAPFLFNRWVSHAKQRYPNYSFQANTETLVNDLTFALAKSLELIWRKENQTKRDVPEWCVGFLLEAAASALNVQWSQEYICKQTPEYKELFFLKTVTQYLKMDTVASKKVEALYNHLLTKQTNTIEQDDSKNEKIVDLKKFKKNKYPNNLFKNRIVNYLESIFFEKHFLIFSDILKNKFPLPLADFFSDDEMMKLIEAVRR